MTIVTVGNRGTTTVKRAPYAASQAQVDAGTVTNKYVSPKTLNDLDTDSSALTDAATIDLTGPKHTLTTASGDNTLPITGATSGDRIDVAILKIDSSYSVAAVNMGQ